MVMINEIRTIYLRGLNKGFDLRFCVDSQVRHETPEEGRRIHLLKRSEYDNRIEDNSR